MTSAVLDVALCLLLVSAAAVTLVTVSEDGERELDGDRADAVATTLTTSTATVNYSLASGARRADGDLTAFPTTSGPEFERSARGTLAGLLADAAVGTVAVDGREPHSGSRAHQRSERSEDGEQLTHTDDGFRTAVRERVERDVADDGVQLLVQWEPYRGSHIRGRVTAGQSPPPSATVHAATVSVPSGLPPARDDARAAAESGYEGVARIVAERVVTGLFPPDDLRFALRADYPVSRFAEYRYRRAGALYDVDVGGDESGDGGGDGEIRPTAANERLIAAVAAVVERDLRETFDSPAEAAASVRVADVRIVVRTWSA